MPAGRLGTLLIAVVSVGASANATTLVVLERDGAVYVGADSWRGLGSLGNQPSGDFVCKIRRYGDVLVASAGYAENTDRRMGLDFVGAFSRASRGWSGAIDHKADLLAREAQRLLGRLLQRVLDSNDPEAPKLLADIERSRQTLIVVGIAAQRPRVAIRVVTLAHSGRVATPTVGSDDFNGLSVKGLDGAYRRLSEEERRRLRAQPPEVVLRDLIAGQARLTPSLVRLPANIVKVSASKPEWLAISDSCKALHGLR
jgi:hypothetical protein